MKRGDRPASSLSHPDPDPNPSLEICLGRVAGRGEVWARVTSGFWSGLRGRGQAKEVFSVVLVGEGEEGIWTARGIPGTQKVGDPCFGAGKLGFFLQAVNLRSLPEGGNCGKPCGPPTSPQGQSPFNSLFIHSFTLLLADSLTKVSPCTEVTPLQTSSSPKRNTPGPGPALPLAPCVTLGKSLTT